MADGTAGGGWPYTYKLSDEDLHRLGQLYERTANGRIPIRSVPDFLIRTRDLARQLRNRPSPRRPAESVLAAVAGQLGAEVLELPGFLTQAGDCCLFWVSAEMTELLRAAAQQLPESCIAHEAVHRPTPHGFAVFERPVKSWVSYDAGLGPVPISGLAWLGTRSPRWDGRRMRTTVCLLPLGSAAAWGHQGMLPLSSTYLFPHASLKAHDDNECLQRAGQNHDPSDEGHRESDENRRLFIALSVLLESTIVVTADHKAARAETRRAERAGVPSDVRVVTLRRAASSSERADDPSYVEWSHRWIVSGHWRNQAYGKNRSERRLTWVSPYVKGPDDKPLVVRPTVGALVR